MLRLVVGMAGLSLALAGCGGSTASNGTGGAAGSGGTGATGGSGASGGSGGSGGGTGGSGGSGGSAGAASCPPGGGGSTLAGVSISFPDQPCVYTLAQAAAGVTFRYTVNVAQSVAQVVPAPADMGHCGQPGPSGLITGESISGQNQSYCLCDTGLCAPPSQQPVTLQPGSYDGTFDWDGTNWSGPSDTGNPHGPPFPPGSYTFQVNASGTVNGASFSVGGTLGFTLVP